MRFSKHDWQHHAVKAINSLPAQLRDCVGYAKPRGADFRITIACESVGQEAELRTITLRGEPDQAFVEVLADNPDGAMFLSRADELEFRQQIQSMILGEVRKVAGE